MTTTAPDVLVAAREIADHLLFPDAMRVDGLDVLPVAHLDAPRDIANVEQLGP